MPVKLMRFSVVGEILVALAATWHDEYQVAIIALLSAIVFQLNVMERTK